MKNGSLNGSSQSALSASESPLAERSVENGAETSTSLDGQRWLVGEVKYRDKSNFPSPFTVLEGRDIAFYKRRTGKPQTLVIMSGEEFEKIIQGE